METVLHCAIGSLTEFLPKSALYPEVPLEDSEGKHLTLDRFFPGGPWGGWQASLGEVLLAKNRGTLHLLPGLLVHAPDLEPADKVLHSLQTLKKVFTHARAKLVEHGIQEIRTGTLMMSEEDLSPLKEGEFHPSKAIGRVLHTLAFRHHLCLIGRESGFVPPAPFVPEKRPNPGYETEKLWASGLIRKGTFSSDRE